MTRIDSRIARIALFIAVTTGLLFGALRNAPVSAAGLAQKRALPQRKPATLPSYWQARPRFRLTN